MVGNRTALHSPLRSVTPSVDSHKTKIGCKYLEGLIMHSYTEHLYHFSDKSQISRGWGANSKHVAQQDDWNLRCFGVEVNAESVRPVCGAHVFM